MGTIGARHASLIIQNARKVLAIEALCAMQGVEYRGIDLMSPALLEKWQRMRAFIPSITEDRIFSVDVEKLNTYLKEETVNLKGKQILS